MALHVTTRREKEAFSVSRISMGGPRGWGEGKGVEGAGVRGKEC